MGAPGRRSRATLCNEVSGLSNVFAPFDIICADAITGLRRLASDSVHCVVTSPPYWGLRNYGLEPIAWGGNPNCLHSRPGPQERGGKRYDILPSEESEAIRIGTL